MKDHHKRCTGERTFNGKKECKICMKWISKANFARHRIHVELVIKNCLGLTIHQQEYGEQTEKNVESVTE